ncbi:outer membrane protein OmpA-like peptidoglycan-associated protein [Dysgonomonas sp. PFB1-18]|uniref:OmpA family protein n=1 Tax=unclassified Dysgonomonas TaxID=2630389 RepID=UPI002476BC0C|nr:MULTISPECIES: OmpA family protein [unclassified Dysgonomonas]MDL2303395.1 OmpA family protein [Dysgonomonas sp. OttesenSCG-928-D17]MDH6307781.1 outer membrane protein OmpA-like peptidoglycan-associated protein [Dysgonomonas sp. PF1-14]MDH6337699.1 outer membrane protein OmpA-like peptidoglycan-associated protein [Dysgonomonas sp. PF1-16]MDH6378923.1 outer membrane protein OmpA-like peptidoglycan-associated protein [Dysgonomonas sp. PFB1-18]MDH6396558.1 outer membrane protein OmpA-like pepti
MKIKFLLLPILLGVLTISLNAQDRKSTKDTDPCNCGSIRDSVLLQLNSGEEVIVVKRSAQQLSVAQSEMAKRRKYFDCPDILAPEPRPETPKIDEPVQKPIEVKPEIKEITGQGFFLPDPVFFRINKSVIDQPEWEKIEKAVTYLNENPNATCVVTGYADKKTGNSAINLRLSKQRSEAVAKAMETKYGIAKNRLSVNWKGDGLQPFKLENDKNRAVLFLINP